MLINNVKNTLDAMNYFRNRNKKIKTYKEKKIETKVIENETKNEIKNECGFDGFCDDFCWLWNL